VFYLMHQIAQQADVFALSLVSEAWALEVKAQDVSGKPLPIPSEHPDRIEILNVVVEMRGEGRTMNRWAKITRKEDGSIEQLGEVMDTTLSPDSGRFSGFFTQGQA